MLLRCVETGGFVPCADGMAHDAAPFGAADLAMRLRASATRHGSPDLHLLLPAARCLVTTVPVARHEVKHLGRTLPWMLEERLLEPTEQVHVAHGPVSAGSAPVSAVNAAWLRQRLDELRAAGLQPQVACSELFLLPWQPGQWTVFIPALVDGAATHAAGPRSGGDVQSTEPVLVRHGAHEGFACARGNLQTALQLLLNEYDEPPREVRVITEAPGLADASLFPTLLQSRLASSVQSRAQLAGGAVLPSCNLLQGRFAPALPWASWWREWRVAAALLAGLLLSDLALTAYDALRLERAAAANEAQMLALYRSVQPEGSVVDPRLQLEQALATAGAAGHAGFLGLLGRMAPALQATPDARVQNLEYDAGSGDLQVQLLTRDYATAESLRTRLQQQGLQAELLGSSRDSAGSRTRLRVGGGA